MKYENRLIWVLGVTFGFLFFDRNAVNYLMPFISAELHFTNKQVGLVASALVLHLGDRRVPGRRVFRPDRSPKDHPAGDASSRFPCALSCRGWSAPSWLCFSCAC